MTTIEFSAEHERMGTRSGAAITDEEGSDEGLVNIRESSGIASASFCSVLARKLTSGIWSTMAHNPPPACASLHTEDVIFSLFAVGSSILRGAFRHAQTLLRAHWRRERAQPQPLNSTERRRCGGSGRIWIAPRLDLVHEWELAYKILRSRGLFSTSRKIR